MTQKLSLEQRNKLKQPHCHENGRRFADRIKTILLLDDGYSYSQIAHILLLDDQTIRNYETIFLEQGFTDLLKTDYKGGLAKLSVEQEAALKDHISNNIYCKHSVLC